MTISNYQNTGGETKLALLRPPMVVPKWGHVDTICPPLGLAYVAASLRQAGYKVGCVDALGEAPLQRIISEDKKFLNFVLSTKQTYIKFESKKHKLEYVE